MPAGAYSLRSQAFPGVRPKTAYGHATSGSVGPTRNSRDIMDTQLGIAVVTSLSHGMMSCRETIEIRSEVGSVTARSSRLNDLIITEACRLLEDIREALDGDLGTASKAAGRLAALLASKLPQGSCSAPARGGLAPWQMRAVRNYIDDRLGGAVRVGDLAKLVSLSASYFSRAFKDSFGELPHAYIVRMRIERAQTLMLTTSSSLSQIAYACGLVDQAHLCRCFRQATGTTPGVWRHRHAVGRPSAAIA
jgi:AraC family transcriptional regulator